MLQDCACLHYALTELLDDATERVAAAQLSAHYTALSAQLRAHGAKLGALSGVRDAERDVLSHRAPALQALAYADQANALHHITLCDAEALRLVGQRCSMAGLSHETRGLLLRVHRVLRQASPSGSGAKGRARSSP